MARTVRDTKLESRAARERLKARGKPYWRELEPQCHLGYRRLSGKAGRWCVRHYAGQQTYQVETIATADDYSDADGVAVLSYRQAQATARQRMVDRAHHAGGKRAGPITVADAVEAYLGFLRDNRKTAADAAYRANAFILPILGAVEVQALTTERLRHWLAALANAPPRLRSRKGEAPRHAKADHSAEARRRRRSSANRVLTTIKGALNFAWREGLVPSDAAWRRVEPFENVDAARLRYLSVAEAKRLLNACDPEFRPLAEAALQTGARYGELARLQVHDFNPDAGTLAIRQSKSGTPRHIVLTDEGQRLFARWCAGRAGDALLFARADGRPWEKSAQGRPMRDACARAKIAPRIAFHGLRHTWASLSVMAGMPLMIVARNLGHRDTRMCERHYSHLSPSFEAESIRAHAPRFGSKPDKKVAALSRRA
jgi:integrase